MTEPTPKASVERRPTIMTLDEVAKYLRVHKSTVYRMAREGTIPSTKVANQWRFKKARIDEWLMEREREGDGDFQ
ncbi:MAG: helix-turn-helix domain-containing protein [Acidobacteriota bacterium]|jgi:excisionase family DNA binding protein